MKDDFLDRLNAIFETGSDQQKRDILAEISDVDVKVPGLLERVLKLLGSEKDRAVKTRMMLVLKGAMTTQDVNAVDEMLRSNDPFVRNGAIDLIKQSQLDWYPYLEKWAVDPDKDVRKFIVDALVNDDSPQARAILRKALHDTDMNVVYTAIEQLGGIGDEESAEAIEEILFHSRHSMVLCSTLEALAKIGKCRRINEVFAQFINHEDSLFLFPLLKFIGRFGGAEQLSFIEHLVDHQWSTYSKEIIDALYGVIRNQRLDTLPKTLLQKLELKNREPQNTSNRYAILQLLTSLDFKNTLENARSMLKDANPMVQLCGIELLADKGKESDILLLESLAERHEGNEELLEAIGDAVCKIDKRLSDRE